MIDETKCSWPIEPVNEILTKIDGEYFSIADMNSAYNQMPLDRNSRRLTNFVIGNQQYEFKRLFYGISIGPAAFSSFMSKIFRPLIQQNQLIAYLDDVLMQTQTINDMFDVIIQYHEILKEQNIKAAPDKSFFFLTEVKFLGNMIKKNEVRPLQKKLMPF